MDVYHSHITKTMYQTLLFPSFYFAPPGPRGDNIKELAHLGSVLQEALTMISLS